MYLESRTNATYKGIEGDWLVLSTPDGQRHWFREDNGVWLSPPENNLRLTQHGATYRVESPGGVTHTFNANGILVSIADAFGNTLTLTYTGTWPNHALDRVEHDNGQFLDFSTTAGRISGITTPWTELSMTLQYAPNGLLTNAVRHITGMDAAFSYHYDSVHSVLTQRVNAVGHRFDYGYDFDAPGGPRGISMQLEDVYYAHTLNYTNQGPNRTEVTYDRDGVSQSFVYAYDATRKTISGIYGPDSMDYGTLLARDANMNVTGETLFDNGLGEYLVTGREFDNRNNVIAESFGYNQAPDSNRWHYVWHEDWNLPTETTDPDGIVQQIEYSNRQPVIARIRAPGESDIVTTFGYRADGLPSAVTNAAGNATAFDYDALGNLSLVIPAVGPAVQMNHNTLGHLQSLVMPYGATNRVTAFDTDAAGRVTGVTLPDLRSSFSQYDLMGRMTNHVDFAGRTTRFEYLPAGRLAESIRYLDGQPVGIRTDFDSQFNLLRVVDELDRNVETYVLDIRDRVVAVTNLEQQVMSVQYGVADIVHSVTRFDGSVVSNVWDHVGRLSEQVLPDTTNAFTYTLGGRMTSVSGSGVTVTNVFDSFMRVVQEDTLDAGPARSVAYTWNPVGTVATATSPAGTRSYSYDSAERLTNLVAESGSFAWTYNPDNGMAASLAHAESGIGAAYGFDITDRLTGIAWNGTIPSMTFSMQYSAADMITNVVYASGEKRVYVYDDLDRLKGERHYNPSQTLTHSADYEYDLAGNRTQMVRNSVTNTYTLGIGNRLDTWTGGSYAYDPAGNVTNITQATDTRSLVWNSQYQLTGVSTNGTLAESYGYDPLGRRAWTFDGSVTNWHVHDGMHLVADLDESGAILRSYTWGPGIDNLLALTVHGATETNIYFAITDHLGTVHGLADDTGVVVESYRFDAWGNILEVRDADGLLSKVNGHGLPPWATGTSSKAASIAGPPASTTSVPAGTIPLPAVGSPKTPSAFQAVSTSMCPSGIIP
jgi:YD repeat-containing protein